MVLCGVWGVRWREVQNLKAFGAKANAAVTGGRGEGAVEAGAGSAGIEMQEVGGRADENV